MMSLTVYTQILHNSKTKINKQINVCVAKR